MLDEDYKVFLIECNSNPDLSTNCPLLSRLIPRLLDHTFRLTVDPILPPNDYNFKRGSESISENQYKLIFDESVEE